ncbi:PilZ domain-containing protein [Desulfobulbus alkaliphilus]|uniref:PilZ domain-containing protein n=1 Tax=Desulfobulbus alkaliphilus TaxID=869814 RepID=UPI001962B9E1|nr:PilZ domain-containing protein [Desulfobulbus alkaliphilus]MBM9537778.1 PilZ domain-containing protein [Desulfobulbus alkaliphilus]
MTISALKAHVRTNGTATLICPACGAVRNVSAERFRHGRHVITARCRCRHVYNILLDFRRHYRKKTNLPGTYEILSEGGVGGGIIHIINISRGGLGFTVSGLHRIEKDQLLLVEFQLNDKKQSVLKKRATVKSVQQNVIGCQFMEDAAMEKALGFFLQT